MRRLFILGAVAWALAACPQNTGNNLPGENTPDSGFIFEPSDGSSGNNPDSGGTDAGSSRDSGSTIPDGSTSSPDAGTGQPDAGSTRADAGNTSAPDGGLPVGTAGCGTLVACTNACVTTMCFSSCLAEGTSQAQQEFDALFTCLFVQQCANTGGGVCDSSAAGYNASSCSSCIATAQGSQGPCYPQLVACTGGPPDAGPGAPDAGYNLPLGTGCTPVQNGAVAQGPCASGLDCWGVTAVDTTLGICTKTCTTANTAACGYHGSVPNFCLGGLCSLGCATNGSVSCGSSQFVCEATGIGSNGICVPECTQLPADYCESEYFYPYNECDNLSGDPLHGACVADGYPGTTQCATGADCGTGQACAPVPGQPGNNLCVPACTQPPNITCSLNADCQSGYCLSGECQSCPLGYGCDPVTSACLIQTVADYAPCDSNVQCPATDICISDNTPVAEGPSPGHCYTICPNTACTSSQTCVMLAAGVSICLIPCSTNAQCPSTTICASSGYCLP